MGERRWVVPPRTSIAEEEVSRHFGMLRTGKDGKAPPVKERHALAWAGCRGRRGAVYWLGVLGLRFAVRGCGWPTRN